MSFTKKNLSSNLIIAVILTLVSCNNPKVINQIPDLFLGKWSETSDDIVIGARNPLILFVKNDFISVLEDNGSEEINKIQEIKLIRKDKLRLTCLKDSLLITEITLLYKDNFIYVSEFVHSGVSDAGGDYGKEFEIGKFYKK